MSDLISTLPDALLCHILSFLPTQKVVRTCVLSKRWKTLWCSVPTLDFNDVDYHKHMFIKEAYHRFVHTVHATLLSRDLHHPIHKLRLKCTKSYGPSNATEWFNAAVQRRVQHLGLNFYAMYPQQPHNLASIFTCKTLVVLKLLAIKLESISSVDLPLLKVLHLQELMFSKGACLAALLSGCPILEEFKASHLYFHEDLTDREFKTLPKLLRAHLSARTGDYLLGVFSNVKFLHIDEIYRSLGEGTRPYVFPMFHNLTHLELDYRFYNDNWSQVVELLQHCPKLQVLVINQPYFDHFGMNGFNEGYWQYPRSDPECILLHLKRCYLNDYRGTSGEFQFATYIMRNGRVLEKMRIRCGFSVNQLEEPKLFKEFSSCTRYSTTCKLSFEGAREMWDLK